MLHDLDVDDLSQRDHADTVLGRHSERPAGVLPDGAQRAVEREREVVVGRGLDDEAGGASDPLAAPAADKYPIEPDKDGVKAKYASEEIRDGWTKYTNEGGAVLGVMDTAKIIQVDGFAFKDLNGDGKLDFYEDWRQPIDERAKALADMMSAEEIFPLLWAGAAAAGGMGTDTDDLGLIKQGS